MESLTQVNPPQGWPGSENSVFIWEMFLSWWCATFLCSPLLRTTFSHNSFRLPWRGKCVYSRECRRQLGVIKETSLLFIIINHKHFSSFNSSHMSFDSNMNNLVVRFTPSLCVIPGGEGEVFSTRVDSLRAFIWRSTHLLTRANGSTHLAVGGLTRLRVDPGLYKRTLCWHRNLSMRWVGGIDPGRPGGGLTRVKLSI